MTGIVVSVLVTVLLASSGSATPTEDIEGYFKDLRKDVMQRFDGLEKSNEALLKELHQFEDAIGPEAKEKANRNQGAGCEDHSRSCSKYAKRGYCRKKADQMLKKCPKSCNACMNVTTLLPAQETTKSSTDAGCVDHSHRCPKYAKKGLCEKKHHLVKICPKSCNACMDVTTQLPAQEATTSSTGAGCEDHSRSCSKYAKKGLCERNDHVVKKCPKSCNACTNVTTLLPAQETTKSSTDAGCVDHSHRCPKYAKKGLCEKKHHLVKICPKSCNACMDVTTQLPAQETTNSSTGAGCEDHSRSCSKYAKRGYCKKKAHQMLKKCPKSCNACTNVTTLLPAQETTKSSTDAGCVDHSHRCPRFAKNGLCEKSDHVVKKCPKSCNACMNVSTQLPAQETTTSSTGAGCEDRSSICSIYAKRGYCNDKGDKLLKLCPKSCNACMNVTTQLPAQETTSSSTAKDRRHRTKDAFLSIDPPSDSDTEQTRQRLNIRHRTPKASIAIDPVPKRPQPRKNIRHRTPEASIAIDPVPKRPQPRKNIRHRTPKASIAIDPVPKRPQPRKTKDRRHRTKDAFLSIDPPSDFDTERTRPKYAKDSRHRTRQPSIAIDPVPKHPQPRKMSLPLAKDRRHRTNEAFLSIDPPSDSDTERTRSKLNIRHRTREASIAIDPVPKRPQPRKTKDRRHRTKDAFLSIDPPSDFDTERTRPKYAKDSRHRTRQPSIAIDPVPKHPQPRKNRRHRTNEAFLSIDPPSASDTEHQQPRFTKPHYTRKAADQVPKRPQRRNGNDVDVDSPHLAVDPVPLGVRQHSREGMNDRVHVRQGRPEADLEQHRIVAF